MGARRKPRACHRLISLHLYLDIVPLFSPGERPYSSELSVLLGFSRTERTILESPTEKPQDIINAMATCLQGIIRHDVNPSPLHMHTCTLFTSSRKIDSRRMRRLRRSPTF